MSQKDDRYLGTVGVVLILSFVVSLGSSSARSIGAAMVFAAVLWAIVTEDGRKK